ncbi:transient receptor potential ion channel subfamily C trp-like protein [Leptotrombidium deliense]|uniref:Transient receptor potential ion channel subfamily C trp-like protein n=1 Tax=Leptotrombidium deliense TaxID=299467 RepID=A0A443SP32_9ACAR|nr:transient receptor potential ion channel subfamily C trp-like protein [Leptotrombidium deliense]
MKERLLTVYDKKFLLCSERGDVVTVKRLLEAHKNSSKLDVNCVDPLGRSALVLAIENENMELIEVLLKQPSIRPGDALLHAINEEYVEAVEVLLQFEETIHKPKMPYSWECIDHNVSTYTKDITPLILAAHRDNYEILKILLDRGATLPLPHDVKCSCDECILATNEDCLKYSRSRINAYRALCSPSLIALSSRDPILTAFQLSWELRRLSKVEMEFAVEYNDLRGKVQHFAVALLDHVRTTNELQICLNYNPNQRIASDPENEQETLRLERLKLAIDYKQKHFVAHPNVQQMLGSVWYDGMPGFRRKGPIKQALEVLSIAMQFPIYSLFNVLLPNTKLGKKLKQPFVKFISHSASYVFFLSLLVLASQRVEYHIVTFFGLDEWSQYMRNAHVKERGKWPSLTECFIILYVLGFIWQETCELIEQGIWVYASNMWNIVDFMTNCVYINWMALRIFSIVQVYIQELRGNISVKLREDWDPYDPLLLSEGMFGAANIFSFLKLVHIFSVHPHLGPLQISLGRMVFDILKFFFLFILVLFAFGCGMNQLLWYYANKDFQKCTSKLISAEAHYALDQDHSCEIWRRFSNLFETSQTLFWASFGLIDLHNFEMTGIKTFTRFWGLLMFGSYSVINVVVLLNLLIAMMSNSYQLISGRSDVEWKFARAKLWISYFDDSSSVPPPFNLMPSCGKFCISVKKKLNNTLNQSFSGSINKKTYENVMRCLVRRYITREQRKAEETGPVTEDSVNEIKQDIAGFRYELLDILFNNGMRVNNKIHSDKDLAGKKERIRERRLLKGFNIGFVEKVRELSQIEGILKEENENGMLSVTKTASIRKRQLVQSRWTTAVTAIVKHNGSQIGRATPEQSNSIVDLREKVLSEKETNDLQKIDEEPKTNSALFKGNDLLSCSATKSLVNESCYEKKEKSDENVVDEKATCEKASIHCIDPATPEERKECNQTLVNIGDNWF